MLKTRITELLGIKYPVFQGGMAWIAEGNLAAAGIERWRTGNYFRYATLTATTSAHRYALQSPSPTNPSE